MSKQVLIIDDDKELSGLLLEYLSSEQIHCDQAFDGESGLNYCKQKPYDLVLLDIMMPGIDGLETLKELRRFSKVPVLMLTARGEDYDKILGLELGADDYLPKPFNHREMLARVKAILRRFDYAQEEKKSNIQKAGTLVMNHNTHMVHIDGEEIELTGTEYQFLAFLLENFGNLVNKDELSREILGRRIVQYDRSIDVHISNLRKKLKPESELEIKTIRGSGYRLVNRELSDSLK
ncbi:response regulator transcription factor [Kangiella taiwanensis]|uniref:Envelope stress response regulator transcription factor CpxR n=1 Tax=Kangiella taiwanensis TaxID=1079179 RepID=A0ABP8I665_9GAMM|nr:response regulator transcription factor [Kangiella taiwanensis]